jgi:hypothetical protein
MATPPQRGSSSSMIASDSRPPIIWSRFLVPSATPRPASTIATASKPAATIPRMRSDKGPPELALGTCSPARPPTFTSLTALTRRPSRAALRTGRTLLCSAARSGLARTVGIDATTRPGSLIRREERAIGPCACAAPTVLWLGTRTTPGASSALPPWPASALSLVPVDVATGCDSGGAEAGVEAGAEGATGPGSGEGAADGAGGGATTCEAAAAGGGDAG